MFVSYINRLSFNVTYELRGGRSGFDRGVVKKDNLGWIGLLLVIFCQKLGGLYVLRLISAGYALTARSQRTLFWSLATLLTILFFADHEGIIYSVYKQTRESEITNGSIGFVRTLIAFLVMCLRTSVPLIAFFLPPLLVHDKDANLCPPFLHRSSTDHFLSSPMSTCSDNPWSALILKVRNKQPFPDAA